MPARGVYILSVECGQAGKTIFVQMEGQASVTGGPKRPAKRPVLDLPLTPREIVLEILAVLGVGVMVYLVVDSWSTLPESIPTHFNVQGEPDSWGRKGTLLLLPIMGLGFYGLMTIVNRFPHSFNYLWQITEENAERQYRLAREMMLWLKLELVWMFAYIEWVIIRTARGQEDRLGILFLPVVLISIFGTLGVYFWQSARAR